MAWRDYDTAVEGVDNVVLRNDCSVLFTPGVLNDVWSSVTAIGTDSGNIGDHHTSAGFTPDTNFGGSPVEAAYEFNGLASAIATAVDANGFQLSCKIDAQYPVGPNTTTNESAGPVVEATSNGWEPNNSATACIFSNSTTGSQLMAKQGSNNEYRNKGSNVVGPDIYFDAIELDFDDDLGTTSYGINGANKTIPPNAENRRITLAIGAVVVTPATLWRYFSTIDGQQLETWTSTRAPSAELDSNNFFFGCRNNAVVDTFPPFVINELLLVQRGPDFLPDGVLQRLVIDGDSLALNPTPSKGGDYATDNSSSCQDLAWWRVFAGRLGAKGIYPQTVTNFGVSTEKMADILARITTTLATDPTTLVFQGLTNDAINKSFDQTVKDDFLDYVEQFFFTATKDGRTNLQLFMINIIPPNFGATTDNDKVIAWNDVWAFQFGFPAVWDALYPNEAGKVAIGGNHAALVNFDHATWDGDLFLSRDGTHWDPLSSFEQGDTLADGFFAATNPSAGSGSLITSFIK